MSLLQEMERFGKADETLSENGMKNLAAYIADYANEEIERGTQYVDRFMIENAISAWQGGGK